MNIKCSKCNVRQHPIQFSRNPDICSLCLALAREAVAKEREPDADELDELDEDFSLQERAVELAERHGGLDSQWYDFLVGAGPHPRTLSSWTDDESELDFSDEDDLFWEDES